MEPGRYLLVYSLVERTGLEPKTGVNATFETL
jgi:hypothetical protein